MGENKKFQISELKFSDIQEATNLVVSQMDNTDMWKGSDFDKKSIALILCNCVFTDNNIAFVAKFNNEIIGIVSGYITKPYYKKGVEVREYGVCLKPEFRGKQIGKLLLCKWIQWGIDKTRNTGDIYMAFMSGENKEAFDKKMNSICFEEVGSFYKLNKIKLQKKGIL
ncbi:GNAT family N-acetyltransferase [Acinetobacter sp.]|uniref:GNAT family N-acetyltransferase n=1 Tax=Acinetobacter sp. TaxID=472 RepID=UPI000C09414E|nr:GNAT family N-acetyltransferase [Acinetobacter sp.]MAK30291.1 hypothetical protein [Acinetobacter sp.]